MTQAVCFEWDGEAMVPLRQHRQRADQAYVVGERYLLASVEDRNMAMHRGYFARVKEAWANLPEELLEEYPSEEHLRKRALIKTGFCTMREAVAATAKQAVAIADMLTEGDEYALVEVSDRCVRVWRADSQKLKRGDNGGMDKARFNASVDAVENWIAQLIGVRPEELRRAA